jgi:hypothetical protein
MIPGETQIISRKRLQMSKCKTKSKHWSQNENFLDVGAHSGHGLLLRCDF